MSNPLLNAIDELESNGLATRPWVMVGLYLSLCQRCEYWGGAGCVWIDGGPGAFASWLVDAENTCDRWAEIHAGQEG